MNDSSAACHGDTLRAVNRNATPLPARHIHDNVHESESASCRLPDVAWFSLQLTAILSAQKAPKEDRVTKVLRSNAPRAPTSTLAGPWSGVVATSCCWAGGGPGSLPHASLGSSLPSLWSFGAALLVSGCRLARAQGHRTPRLLALPRLRGRRCGHLGLALWIVPAVSRDAGSWLQRCGRRWKSFPPVDSRPSSTFSKAELMLCSEDWHRGLSPRVSYSLHGAVAAPSSTCAAAILARS